MHVERKLMLVIDDIHKSFGEVEAVRGVSADIKEGELITFLGPSGCGKTTLLRIISGLTTPDSGKIILDGQVINDITPEKRGIQMCFQNYALFPHLTVAGNIRYGPEVQKWQKNRIEERLEEMLQLVHLDGLGDRRIDELSGGQQQRVALARALALEPKVLLLDEPLSNLDANLRVQMRDMLREIQSRVNITTVFVTHDQVEAMCFQNYALFPHLTVAGNIRYGPEVQKWQKNRIEERLEEMLQLVHLDGLGDRRIDELSGGQQQRVALARALALEPKVLLLDEPLSNLDANLRVQMRDMLREIQSRLNITTVFVTHDQVEAMTISDRLIIMREGVLEQVGPPVVIYENPDNEFIASFIGYVNILKGEVKSIGNDTEPTIVSTELGDLEILGSEKDIKVDWGVYLIIRPETVLIGSPEEAIEVNRFKGTIKSIMYAGSTVKYVADIEGKDLIIDQYDPATLGIRGMGDKVMVTIPRNVHVLKE